MKITGTAHIPIMFMDAAATKTETQRTYKENGEIYRNAGIEPQ